MTKTHLPLNHTNKSSSLLIILNYPLSSHDLTFNKEILNCRLRLPHVFVQHHTWDTAHSPDHDLIPPTVPTRLSEETFGSHPSHQECDA